MIALLYRYILYIIMYIILSIVLYNLIVLNLNKIIQCILLYLFINRAVFYIYFYAKFMHKGWCVGVKIVILWLHMAIIHKTA